MRLYFRFLDRNIFFTLKLIGLEFDISQYRLLIGHELTWREKPLSDRRKFEHFSAETFVILWLNFNKI